MIDKADEGYTFLLINDPLASLINKKANELFTLLRNFDASTLNISEVFKDYFINHHLGNRLFFSIENSAHIIYQSVKKTKKPIEAINFVDYGAGLGTLYMLGGMLHFKRLVYNDYLPDWKDTAQSICESLKIPISDYITGDIDEVLNKATKDGYTFDIIASRNVIEHIYSLPAFFSKVYQHNPFAVIFSTTSANFHNPAMRLRHYFIHKRVEKESYFERRKAIIKENWISATPGQLKNLTIKTRGMAANDLLSAINHYRTNGTIARVPFLRTNTCDPETGYWCEHLLKKNEYAQIIEATGYKMQFTAGYWDTHYRSKLMNILAKCFNKIINILGAKGYQLSPFVNIIAYNEPV